LLIAWLWFNGEMYFSVVLFCVVNSYSVLCYGQNYEPREANRRIFCGGAGTPFLAQKNQINQKSRSARGVGRKKCFEKGGCVAPKPRFGAFPATFRGQKGSEIRRLVPNAALAVYGSAVTIAIAKPS
jgi:hypothetical protein